MFPFRYGALQKIQGILGFRYALSYSVFSQALKYLHGVEVFWAVLLHLGSRIRLVMLGVVEVTSLSRLEKTLAIVFQRVKFSATTVGQTSPPP